MSPNAARLVLRFTALSSVLSFSSLLTAQSVSVTTTSADQTQQLTAQPAIAFGKGGSGAFVINVDDSQTFQLWDGVGAAMTDSSASVISGMSTSAKDALMQQLFSQTNGIGLNFVRDPMGASDFTNGLPYTYDDGQADPTLANFSIQHDLNQIIPLIKQAQAINPNVKVLITPWSPPAWMKPPTSTYGIQLPAMTFGGNFNFTYADSLAQYFVKTIQGYQAQYVPVYALSVQNEPLNSTISYPSEYLDQPSELSLVNNNVGPALANAGLSNVKIFGYDHNWDNTAYPEAVASSPYTAGSAFHCYAGDPSAEGAVGAATGKDSWMTECTAISTQSYATNLQQDAEKLTIGPILNGARASVMWNIALNELYGPTITGGLVVCKDCLGVVDVTAVTNSISYSSEYYAMGQVGRFVVPGAYRVAATSQGNGQILDVAFRNPDGTIAVIAYNDSAAAETITLNWNNQLVDYPLAAGTMATFKWQGNGGVGFSSTGNYTVTNVNSGLCLDATNAAITSGTTLQQNTCTPGALNQQWQLLPTDSGYFRIVSRNGAINEQVWDITGGPSATSSQTPMETNLWAGGTGQQFKPVALGNGKWNFVSRNGGLCLGIPSAATSPHVVAQQQTCSATPSEQFTLQLQ